MKEKITESTYEGYKQLYLQKQDLPSLIVLVLLLDVLAIGGLAVINIPLLMAGLSNVSVGILCCIAPILIGSSIVAIAYDYNEKIYKLKARYPYINSKIRTHKLEKMLAEYKIMKRKVKKCEEIKKEVLSEPVYTHSSLEYSNIPEELERVKVKVKTLTNRR